MGNTKQEQINNEIVPVNAEIKDIGSLVYVIRGKQVRGSKQQINRVHQIHQFIHH